MSSVRLTKDRDGVKAGTVISVPFGLGQELVASGVGQYPTSPPVVIVPNASTATAADRHGAEMVRLNKLHASAIREVREECAAALAERDKVHAAEVAKLTADLDAANKAVTDLQSKAKK